ncbi:MAG: tRNA pseudouridine38-40 synthase [Acidobacteriota bacterium]|jgi:tRNA pseudouridine38-40 synthase
MRNLKVTVQYDGTDYVGWQRQGAGVSIQGLLEDALVPIEGSGVTVHGAGRTDAGVHALAQVASFGLSVPLDPVTLTRALNGVLPPAVRVTAAEDVDPGFHARFSATGKVYEYRVVNAPFVSPFLHKYAWHVPAPLDLDAMREASRLLVGTRDFEAFQGTGSSVASTTRTVHSLEWTAGAGGDTPTVMRIEGNGFLRHMVRNIAGTLVDLGSGRWQPSDLAGILDSRDRARAGRTAPARGLFLAQVLY